MQLAQTIEAVRSAVKAAKNDRNKVGLVPTMGALHVGHVSLIKRALEQCDFVVVSIFVNPTQFGPGEDFSRYPRPESADLQCCAEAGVDAVFLPSVAEMYPPDATVRVTEETLSRGLCGATRPGHFSGVLTVVAKLFHIVQPSVAVFGRKDAQQLALIERMVRDLDIPVRILPAPIIREPDGLAMSSRNVYLSPEERRHALCLRRALDRAEAAFREHRLDAAALASEMLRILQATPGTVVSRWRVAQPTGESRRSRNGGDCFDACVWR